MERDQQHVSELKGHNIVMMKRDGAQITINAKKL